MFISYGISLHSIKNSAMKDHLLSKFHSRFEALDLNLLMTAYFLSPNYYQKYLTKDAKDLVLEVLLNQLKLKHCTSDVAEKFTTEFYKYMKRMGQYSIPPGDDMVKWWSDLLNENHNDFALAGLSYSSLIPSSADAERLFSYSNWFFSDRRNCLTVKSLEDSCILKYFFNYLDIEHPKQKKTQDVENHVIKNDSAFDFLNENVIIEAVQIQDDAIYVEREDTSETSQADIAYNIFHKFINVNEAVFEPSSPTSPRLSWTVEEMKRKFSEISDN